jgi:nuclear pore complex protein Nup155
MASAFQSFNGRAPGTSGFNSIRQAPVAKPAPVDLNALQNASRVLLDQLAKDAQGIPDLGETLTGGARYPSPLELAR